MVRTISRSCNYAGHPVKQQEFALKMSVTFFSMFIRPQIMPFQDSLVFVVGRHLQSVCTMWRAIGDIRGPHPISPSLFSFILGDPEACYSTLSSSLPSKEGIIGAGTLTSRHQKAKQKGLAQEFLFDSKEEKYAQKFRRAIFGVKNATVEDVVQSLRDDASCSRIPLSPNLVDGLLHKFGDDWKSALGFFEWANSHMGYVHTSFAYEKMVDLLGKMRQMDRMWDLVHKMHEGGHITLETIGKVMRRLAGARRWSDAMKCFDNLESLGFNKNIQTMNLLLDTLCKEKRVDIAREAFLVLKDHISPNAYTYNIFVHGWCNAHKVDEARWTIQDMRVLGFKPSVITYSTVIQAYCHQFKFRRAYELLDEMANEGCIPNVVTYTTIMNSLAKARQVDQALDVVKRMKMAGCSPDTLFYNSLINILGKAGRLQDAYHIFKVEMKMNGVSYDLSTYNTMISIFCCNDQENDALAILKEMENSSCHPDLQTYRPLLRLCFTGRRPDDHVISLLNNMADKHHLSLDLDMYTLLINGFCRAGNIGQATLLFNEMIDREIKPRRQTYLTLMYEAEHRNMYPHVEMLKNLMNRIQSWD